MNAMWSWGILASVVAVLFPLESVGQVNPAPGTAPCCDRDADCPNCWGCEHPDPDNEVACKTPGLLCCYGRGRCLAKIGFCQAKWGACGDDPSCPPVCYTWSGKQYCYPDNCWCDRSVPVDPVPPPVNPPCLNDNNPCTDDDCNAVSASTVCRDSLGMCDAQELCAGTICPADNKLPAGTVCRASSNSCDVAEVCDGVNNSCPSDSLTSSVVRKTPVIRSISVTWAP